MEGGILNLVGSTHQAGPGGEGFSSTTTTSSGESINFLETTVSINMFHQLLRNRRRALDSLSLLTG
ncbi:unnamed protein product [Acanthoscelides obtectus]|uniref:Uncharacterized protein n=1 Tax=Acanthoscelides obtectus TaxID=200917 RepID=A0A9P0PJQ8_ACAOB|nr:unnamed protein product [Acanthoscelides obtectus]CAH2010183.1 unnamed protein product [Acanthoscelides obtectus]CAK1624218.1 hypothetical protein AOBTE_LOCUS2413 [Acanthoscelides obtectus]CAK1633003.1 hypothetical protein AOBTE_LOCUS7870 [Acanthoscelides obtectus]